MSAFATLAAVDRSRLLEIARASIRHGLRHDRALTVNPAEYSTPLCVERASFVTLERDGQLRGCIGTLTASQPLAQDVAVHAYAAAFEDPRFPPLRPEELPELAVFISVLSPPESLRFHSEPDLLAQLQPGVDGLILQFRRHRATFLPAVWEQLPEPVQFLTQLKHKAGLPADFWSPELRVERYVAEYFGEDDPT